MARDSNGVATGGEPQLLIGKQHHERSSETDETGKQAEWLIEGIRITSRLATSIAVDGISVGVGVIDGGEDHGAEVCGI